MDQAYKYKYKYKICNLPPGEDVQHRISWARHGRPPSSPSCSLRPPWHDVYMLSLYSVIWTMKYDDRPHDHQGYLVLNQVLWGRQRVHTSSNSEPRSSNTYQNIRPALILTTGMISKKGLQVLQIFSLRTVQMNLAIFSGLRNF